MGWLVDVDFKTSSVHGTGIFARRHIRAGTRVWQVDETMRITDAAGLAALSPGALAFALHGGYLHKPSDRFIWYHDGMQYMNHATTPLANIGLGHWPALDEDHCIALRNIAPGEELTEDYTFWSDGGVQPGHWLHRLYVEFCPAHLQFLSSLDTLREAA